MARNLYKVDGVRVPSVTTILSRFKESGGLLYWANEAGRNGLTLEEARTPAATAGSVAHDMVEAFIKQQPAPSTGHIDKAIVEKAQNAFATFVKWFEMNNITIRHTEVELVSTRHRFGGRLDAIGVQPSGGDGKNEPALCLLDWKTSAAIYADYVLQLAAYKILWEENYPDHPLGGGFHIARFAKEEGDFGHFFYPALDHEAETFLQMRKLYDMIKQVEKRVK